MAVVLECNYCGQKMKVPEDWLGKRMLCPTCRSEIPSPPPDLESLPEIDESHVVEEAEDREGTYAFHPDDALDDDSGQGSKMVTGPLGTFSLGSKTGPAQCLAIRADNRVGLAGCGRTIHVLNLSEDKRAGRFEGLKSIATSLAIGPDGRLALAGDDEGGLLLFDLETLRLVRRLEGHEGAVRGVAFSPLGRVAASCGDDGATYLWDLETAQNFRLARWDEPVACVAFSPDGRQVLAAGSKVRSWEVRTGEPIVRFRGVGFRSAAYSQDGTEVAACSPAGFGANVLKAQRWESATGKSLPCLEKPARQQVRTILASVAPRSLKIVSVGRNREEDLEHAKTAMKAALKGAAAIASFPTLRWGLIRDAANTVGSMRSVRGRYCFQVWNLALGTAMTFDAGDDLPVALAVSPDGNRALVATSDHNAVQVWGLPL
jgi:hypothetical protein